MHVVDSIIKDMVPYSFLTILADASIIPHYLPNTLRSISWLRHAGHSPV